MSFFKAYDMRGTFGVDFTLPQVTKIARALPSVVGGKNWLVGRDMRNTSPQVHKALVQGLCEVGVKVTDLGLCTTPMVYFFTAQDNFDGSVMVTASHNPAGDNGLKVSKKTALPVGYDSGLAEVERLIKDEKPLQEVEVRAIPLADSKARYLSWMKERLPQIENLHFAVDCSNGMSSLLAKDLFPNAIILNDELDGNFPAHSPNPLNPEARESISRIVKEKNLDCGVIFDGDADRAMFVDENGEFIQPDYLIPLIARSTLRFAEVRGEVAKGEKVKIIHDVRTSRGAIEVLKEEGFEPVMVPVGHAFAKPRLREVGALCGGELAGHYYFKEFFGCDSGILAAMRVLGEIARSKKDGVSFRQLVQPICGRYVNSGEINFRTDDKDGAISRVLEIAKKEFSSVENETTIDGVRLDYADGWLSIRKSNTEPYLRLLVECKSEECLKKWTSLCASAIEGRKI